MLKKILKIFLILVVILVVAILGLVGYICMQPADFRVERSATINAPAADVFAHVNDFKKWKKWSPWEKLDPNMKQTFEGPKSGKGAVSKWVGNDDVGEGKMTITESKPGELIRMKLEFKKPMESAANVEFKFKEKDGKTEVTWIMYGQSNFVGKAFTLFMDIDKMVGEQYDKGLANLKSVAEGKNAE